MEEVASLPSPTPPPAPSAGPQPWIERWTTTLMLLALTIPTDAAMMYGASYQRMPSYTLGFIVLAWLMGNLLRFIPWSGLWALVSKVFRRQTLFFDHLNTALLAGLLWTWLRTVLDVSVFALSADAGRAVPYFLLLGTAWTAIFWGHLRLVSVAPRGRLLAVAALIGLLIVGLGSGARTLTIRRMPAARTADIQIMPHFLRLATPGSVSDHLAHLKDLQRNVDARVKEL